MKTIFKIEDGREKFYQWDLNRRILVEDDSITQVHFANAATTTAYVVSVSAGMANVPNIILQQNFDIKVYGYDKEFTKFEKTFEVEKRSKPQDYVYTETEILNYETLANEIKEVKENIPSTAGLATEEYVNEAVAGIEIPEVDLSGYALKSEIPSTAGLATETYVNNKVQGLASTDYVDQAIAAVPQPDLGNYITKNELEDNAKTFEMLIMFKVSQKGYQTSEEVNTAISDALNAIGVAEGRTY